MTSTAELAPPSSPAAGGGSLEQDLAYYKAQYEQLDVELQEFQASSRELEAELERDIEASEKRERQLKEKLEGMAFEVDEWKAKYKQSKTEANGAQNALQKEITNLRDANRTLLLNLRDTEVANDDFERQARNQTSSLEDLEQKYNVSIERGVMLEEEIKVGEQEREDLRIENQRLRDELSDLSIEADIVREKLRAAEDTIARHRDQKTHALVTADSVRPRSPVSETSTSATTLSSPTTSTPPPIKSNRTSATTPPSPNFADRTERSRDRDRNVRRITPMQRKRSIAVQDSTPRPRDYGPPRTRHTRDPSVPWSSASGRTTPSTSRRTTGTHHQYRASAVSTDGGLPRSGSLHQIRGLIGKMQKLEARVHNVRSKLPAPTQTPPRASPRNGSAASNHASLPSNVTLRSSTRKRTSGSTNSSTTGGLGDTGVSKLSFGTSSTAKSGNASGLISAPGGNISGGSRPSSRTSDLSGNGFGRPPSRSSNMGRTTPLGHYSTNSTTEARRPRSSMGGQFTGSGALLSTPGALLGAPGALTFSTTPSFVPPKTRSRAQTSANLSEENTPEAKERNFGSSLMTPLVRKPDFTRSMGSGIPTPGSTGIPTPSGLPRRASRVGRRASVDATGTPPIRGMPPPMRSRDRKLSEVGETY